MLPSIQNVLGVHKSGLNSMRDRKSGRLDRSTGDHFSNMDRQSGRLDKSFGDHCSQLDHRSRRLDKSPGERFSQLDQQDRCKLNSKFSIHGGLNSEISVDSRADKQDCDIELTLYNMDKSDLLSGLCNGCLPLSCAEA